MSETTDNQKSLYWLVESNGDLSVTIKDLDECKELILGDKENEDENQKDLEGITVFDELQYTLTPVYLTDKEFADLDEA